MKSGSHDLIPSRVRSSLSKLGADLSVARRKRGLTVNMIAQRVGVARATYLKVEKGDPAVSMAVYAMTLFALGFAEVLGDVADASKDDTGLLLDRARLPRRIRVKKQPQGL
jgi:DNA-binding XRE family transcriptional regulator